MLPPPQSMAHPAASDNRHNLWRQQPCSTHQLPSLTAIYHHEQVDQTAAATGGVLRDLRLHKRTNILDGIGRAVLRYACPFPCVPSYIVFNGALSMAVSAKAASSDSIVTAGSRSWGGCFLHSDNRTGRRPLLPGRSTLSQQHLGRPGWDPAAASNPGCRH